MSRFVTTKTNKLDLGDGEWIEYKEGVAFADLQPIIELFSSGDEKNKATNIKFIFPLLELAIVNWNLKDDGGKEVTYEKEMLKKLDIETLTEIAEIVIEKYLPEKKNQ